MVSVLVALAVAVGAVVVAITDQIVVWLVQRILVAAAVALGTLMLLVHQAQQRVVAAS